MKHSVLMHEKKDDVAVAVVDITAGTEIGVATLEGEFVGTVLAVNDIPLGHKIALRDIKNGENVLKYGRPIGHAVADIAKGSHVHVHNLKSNRW
ncbi:MAG TPA: UxaA family hydrolase [Anaerolineaceae bacterium]